MRLKEILNEAVDPAGQKLITDTLVTLSRENFVGAKDFVGYRKFKIVGSDNLVTVKFMLGDSANAAGSMSFGTGVTQDELDFDEKEKLAMNLASALVSRLGDFIHIEDYTIRKNEPGYRPSVNLFMVSDGFIGNEL